MMDIAKWKTDVYGHVKTDRDDYELNRKGAIVWDCFWRLQQLQQLIEPRERLLEDYRKRARSMDREVASSQGSRIRQARLRALHSLTPREQIEDTNTMYFLQHECKQLL